MVSQEPDPCGCTEIGDGRGHARPLRGARAAAAPPAQGAGMRHGRLGTGSTGPSPCATRDPRQPQPKPGLTDFLWRVSRCPTDLPGSQAGAAPSRVFWGRAGTPTPHPSLHMPPAPTPALFKHFYDRGDQSTRRWVCVGTTVCPLPETPCRTQSARPGSSRSPRSPGLESTSSNRPLPPPATKRHHQKH